MFFCEEKQGCPQEKAAEERFYEHSNIHCIEMKHNTVPVRVKLVVGSSFKQAFLSLTQASNKAENLFLFRRLAHIHYFYHKVLIPAADTAGLLEPLVGGTDIWTLGSDGHLALVALDFVDHTGLQRGKVRDGFSNGLVGIIRAKESRGGLFLGRFRLWRCGRFLLFSEHGVVPPFCVSYGVLTQIIVIVPKTDYTTEWHQWSIRFPALHFIPLLASRDFPSG